MNKERRKQISDLAEQLSNLKDELESIQGEEQEYYDNIPENMQQGEKAEASENAISSLDSAMDFLTDAISALEEVE